MVPGNYQAIEIDLTNGASLTWKFNGATFNDETDIPPYANRSDCGTGEKTIFKKAGLVLIS